LLKKRRKNNTIGNIADNYYSVQESLTMPKMKTNRGAAKRFKATGSGKIVRSKAFASHILTKKTTKRKRGLRKSDLVDEANMKGIKRIMPYL
jgi:large subunit ribosomal protein L35